MQSGDHRSSAQAVPTTSHIYTRGREGFSGDDYTVTSQMVSIEKGMNRTNAAAYSELQCIINELVDHISRLEVLGYLNVHCALLRIIADNDDRVIKKVFWGHDRRELDENHFNDYFQAVHSTSIFKETSKTSKNKTNKKPAKRLDPCVQEFCRKYNVEAPNSTYLGNVGLQFYRTFAQSVYEHGEIRVASYLWNVIFCKVNGTTSSGDSQKCDDQIKLMKSMKQIKYEQDATVKAAIDYLFEGHPLPEDKTAAVYELLEEIEMEFNPIEFNTKISGYFNNLKDNWYRHVPFFVKLQQFNRQHNRLRSEEIERRSDKQMMNEPSPSDVPWLVLNDLPPQLPDFAVIPVSCYGRKSLFIDRYTLRLILSKLTGENRIEEMQTRFEDLPQDSDFWKRYWAQSFEIKDFESSRAGITFIEHILTNSASLTVFLKNESSSGGQQQTRHEKAEALLNADREVSLDFGFKLAFGGIIVGKDEAGDEIETNVRLSKRLFTWMCQNSKFENQRNAVVRGIGKGISNNDRDVDGHSLDFIAYAKHMCKYFNKGMATYGSVEYAEIDLNAYIQKKWAIEQVVKLLVGDDKTKKTFFFMKNSDGKTPVRLFIEELSRHPNVTLHYVDELKASVLCSRCGEVLEDVETNIESSTKMCRQCVPMRLAMAAMRPVNSHQNQRQEEAPREWIDDEYVHMQEMVQNGHNGVVWEYRRYKAGPQDGVQSMMWNRDINTARNLRLVGEFSLINEF